jgi:hypothetical protein
MAGTFLPGDHLIYHQVPFKKIRRGDVVLIASGQNEVVHRVIEISSGGLITCGDANSSPDPDTATPQTLIGLVSYYERKNVIRKVAGGNAGLLWLAWLQSRRKLIRLLRIFGGWFYRRLRASHIIQFFWRPKICQLSFQTPGGKLIKFVVRGKTVATWEPQRSRFTCRRPYDLIIFPPEVATIEKGSIAALD